MNAYHFKVKQEDNFFNELKLEATKLKISMKKFIVEAVKEKMEKLKKP